MDFRQIKFFLTTARCLNFTNAAMELRVSQATLSRQIKDMEAELNLLLFFRDNRNVRLTESGKYLYQEYQNLYDNYTTITNNAKRIFAGYESQLNIGVLNEITLQGSVQTCLQKFMHQRPNLAINLRRHSFKGLTNGLLDGSLDLGITLLFDITSIPTLSYRILGHVTDGILISSTHPLAKEKIFHIEDFKNETFITLADTESSFVSENMIQYCKKHGFYPNLLIAPDLDTAMLWTEAGLGLSFSFSKAVSVLNPAMSFIPLPPNELVPESKLVLAWNQENLNPAITAFLNDAC